MGVEELVYAGHRRRRGAPGLEGIERQGEPQAVELSAPEPHVDSDRGAAHERDVFDEKACHALAFALGGGRVAPQRWEVRRQGHDGGALGVVEAGRGATLTLVVVLGGGQVAQRGVPVGFERVGDQAVGWVDS